jgi:hypothetical protein
MIMLVYVVLEERDYEGSDPESVRVFTSRVTAEDYIAFREQDPECYVYFSRFVIREVPLS